MENRQLFKDSVWLNVATEISKLSKDQNTHIGAVLIKSDGRVLSTGYNGGAQGIDDSRIPHSREIQPLEFVLNGITVPVQANKYPFMVHAEANAISTCNRPEEIIGATMYVTHKPCIHCAWNIVRHKIKRVVIKPDSDTSVTCGSSVGDEFNLSLFMFAEGGVDVYIGSEKLDIRKKD